MNNMETNPEFYAEKLRDAAWKAHRAVAVVGASPATSCVAALREAGQALIDFASMLVYASPEVQTLAAWSADLTWIPMEGRTPTLADVAASFCTAAAIVHRDHAYHSWKGGHGRPEDERMLGRLKADWKAGAAGTSAEARGAAIRAAEKDALALRAAEKEATAEGQGARGKETAKDVLGALVVRTVVAGASA